MIDLNKVLLLIIAPFLIGCMSTVKIASIVEKNKEGDFLLKWEVSPDVEGKIDIWLPEPISYVPIGVGKILGLKAATFFDA